VKTVLVDAGPLYALFDAKDRHHAASVRFIKQNNRPLATTAAVIAEVCWLLDFSVCAQSDFLRWIGASGIAVEHISAADVGALGVMVEKYADVPMDFADATLVFLAERLQTDDIASWDSDFGIYRTLTRRRLRNVLDV
jgi:predicted nucleic acid-binding protein